MKTLCADQALHIFTVPFQLWDGKDVSPAIGFNLGMGRRRIKSAFGVPVCYISASRENCWTILNHFTKIIERISFSILPDIFTRRQNPFRDVCVSCLLTNHPLEAVFNVFWFEFGVFSCCLLECSVPRRDLKMY